MKKSFFSRLVSLISVMVVGGCLLYAANPDIVREILSSNVLGFLNAGTDISESETEIVETDGGYMAAGRTVQIHEDEGILVAKESADEKRFLQEKLTDAYAYNKLTKEEQNVYLEILFSLLEFEENVELSSLDNSEISYIFQCVLNDHPEIFYVNGYSYTQYTLADIPKKLTFTGTYSMDKEEVEKKQVLINNYVNQCLAGIPEGADEYETVKYIYEYLIEHTEYDASVKDNQNICSVFTDGRSVCQGYAKATQYLLQQAGMCAELVLGRVSSGEGHAWNLVKIDGNWYYVDTTWGDASYRTENGEEVFPEQKVPAINYDYLCVTTAQIATTHIIDNVVELPQCTSMDANYYVREGLYFTEVDEEKLTGIFNDGYDKGSAYVTLKCASKEVYDEMCEKLINNQEIFHYLDCPDGIVSYTDSDEQFSMSFWL
ncbi:MAG: hypothetical protein K2K21_11395 [Lachnospiraceae bacterium]|nr:hypothetical protein [Lachnospiraceae bacterium]